MTRLTPDAVSIIRALFALATLTAVMAGWMTIVRTVAMRRAGVVLQDAAHTADLNVLLPSWARRVADNFNHLLQVPTVFYAASLGIVVAGLADVTYAWCAWTFVGMRVLHSVVQATFNKVAVRALLYAVAWLPLAILLVRPLFSL